MNNYYARVFSVFVTKFCWHLKKHLFNNKEYLNMLANSESLDRLNTKRTVRDLHVPTDHYHDFKRTGIFFVLASLGFSRVKANFEIHKIILFKAWNYGNTCMFNVRLMSVCGRWSSSILFFYSASCFVARFLDPDEEGVRSEMAKPILVDIVHW